MQAIGELIALGEPEGFGITFNPDETGWTVGYLGGMGGADLLTASSWATPHGLPLRPLLELFGALQGS